MKNRMLEVILILTLMAGALPAFETQTTTTEEFPKLKLSGFARVRWTYDWTKDKANGFSIAQTRFGVTGAISKEFNYTFSLETTNTDTENRKMVYDVYVDTTIVPWLRIRAGQFKYAFGLEQSTPDADLELINKADVVANLVKPTRDIGLQVAKDFQLGKVNSTVTLALINGSGSNLEDENSRKTFVGRLLVTPLAGLTLGGSYYSGTTAVTNDKKERFGAELKYEWWRLLFKAEYIGGTDKAVKKDGYYLTLGFNALPATVLLVRFDRWNPDRSAAGKETSRWTFALNHYFSRNILWRTNYEFKTEAVAIDNNVFMTQIQVKF